MNSNSFPRKPTINERRSTKKVVLELSIGLWSTREVEYLQPSAIDARGCLPYLLWDCCVPIHCNLAMPGSGSRRINQRMERNAKRCDVCREVQHHWVCLLEVADSGFLQQGGLWVEYCEDELLDTYKLCKICRMQVEGLLEVDLIWEIVE